MNTIEYASVQETKYHGTGDFPFNIYLCNIPLDFPIVPMHWHNDMEIIYIKKGRGLVNVNLHPYAVSGGDILIIPPGQLHSIEQEPNQSMEYENIIFQLNMLMAPGSDSCSEQLFEPLLQRRLQLCNYFTPESFVYPALSGCLNRLDDICRNLSPGYEFAVKGQLFTLFHTLLPFIRKTQPGQQKQSLEHLKAILKYVEKHYSEKLSIEAAAKICGFSQSHFMKFFKQNMSVSFVDYLNTYRLTMASRLLTCSADSITEIAVSTGFDNLSYFNRLFKRKYGCTPTDFRNQKMPLSLF